ncbi:reverse transcriptase domain-containing protein [Tanacetum coccineum]
MFPSFCKHKIQLLDDKKPVVQKQRRLNPNMHEVVKKEIIKLLDTGIINPIADSPWVSPIHCVPKKGGITVVTNEKLILVPTRTVTGWRNQSKCSSFPITRKNVHVMVKEGIVLGHKGSSAGLEVDKAKINVISKLPPPTNIKGVRSFLGHTSFYRRFIKDFSKIARPITKLLEKDTPFEFNDECKKAFESLKEKLTCAPVIVSPIWNLPLELMCDASDFTVGAVLGQKENTVKDNPAIWSRKLDDALWAFRTAYKTPTGTTPYKLIYGKNCHLPFEIEHRAYWALKNCNPDLIAAGEKRMFQLHELDELRYQAYENSRLYKERTKVWHDRKL